MKHQQSSASRQKNLSVRMKVRLELLWWRSNLPKWDLKSQKESCSRRRQASKLSLFAQIFQTRLFSRRGRWTTKGRKKGRRNLSAIVSDCQMKNNIFATNATLTQIVRRCLKATICTNIRNEEPSVTSAIKGFSQMNIYKITFTQSTISQLTAVLRALSKREQRDNL